MKIKRCEMEKLDPVDKCRERARHTLQFKYNKLGSNKDLKIRICETHRQIFEDNGSISEKAVYDLEGSRRTGKFNCTLITDRI